MKIKTTSFQKLVECKESCFTVNIKVNYFISTSNAENVELEVFSRGQFGKTITQPDKLTVPGYNYLTPIQEILV